MLGDVRVSRVGELRDPAAAASRHRQRVARPLQAHRELELHPREGEAERVLRWDGSVDDGRLVAGLQVVRHVADDDGAWEVFAEDGEERTVALRVHAGALREELPQRTPHLGEVVLEERGEVPLGGAVAEVREVLIFEPPAEHGALGAEDVRGIEAEVPAAPRAHAEVAHVRAVEPDAQHQSSSSGASAASGGLSSQRHTALVVPGPARVSSRKPRIPNWAWFRAARVRPRARLIRSAPRPAGRGWSTGRPSTA